MNEEVNEMADVEIFSPEKVFTKKANSQLVISGLATAKQPDEPLICPVCQQKNQCAVSVGKPIQDCWCLAQSTKASISARVLDDLIGKACVCQRCYRELSD